MYVAVTPNREVRGVRAPGENGLTYDWTCTPGSPGNTAGIRAHYEIWNLEEALYNRWNDDHHMVGYIVFRDGKPLRYQPRINQSGILWMYKQGYDLRYCTQFGDWDNPGHKKHDLESLERSFWEWCRNPWLRNVGGYYTQHGQRIVQPILEMPQILSVRYLPRLWIAEARRHGIILDPRCIDAVRNYRAPDVLRAGVQTKILPSLMDMIPRSFAEFCAVPRFHPQAMEEMGPHGQAVVEKEVQRFGWESDQQAAPGPRRPSIPIGRFKQEIPEEWKEPLRILGEAARQIPVGHRHDFYLHFSGFLVHRKLAHEYVPYGVYYTATVAGHDGNHHAKSAEDTATRHAQGHPITGLNSIAKDYPDFAQLADRLVMLATQRRVEDRKKAAAANAPSVMPLPMIQEKLYNEIRFAENGITFIAAGCGVGKTWVLQQVAKEQVWETPLTETGRTKSEARMIILCDKNSLAMQTAQALRDAGVPVQRYFGPVSLLDDQGKPICFYHAAAKEIAAGGLSVYKLMCSQCERLKFCKAAVGWEGEEKAPIVVGSHAKGKSLITLGKRALTAIDEPPPAIHNRVLTGEEMLCALKNLYAFESRFSDAMRPLLRIVIGWLREWEIGTTVWSLADLVKAGAKFIDTQELVEALTAVDADTTNDDGIDALTCAQRAYHPEAKDFAPPLKKYEIFMARQVPARARTLGRAAWALRILQEAAASITAPRPSLLRIEEHRDQKVVRIISPNQLYRAVLMSQERIVILDATADLQVPAVAALTGKKPVVRRFSAADGTTIRRFVLPLATATRSMWLPLGYPLWNNGILAAIHKIIVWARSRPARDVSELCLITFQPIAIAMLATLHPQEARYSSIWGDEGLRMHPDALTAARQTLRPLLAQWAGGWQVGYFGGTRGLNVVEKVPLLATMGDPRPNIDTIQLLAQYFELKEDDLVDRYGCAELEQSHGRIRAPQRKPGEEADVLHVGTLIPGGTGWNDAESLDAGQGERFAIDAMSALEFKTLREQINLTQQQVADQLHVNVRTIKNYESGARSIRSGIAFWLRRLARPVASDPSV